MVADALEGERTIGMAMMRPGWERAGANPPIFAVGGAGRIVDSETLPDGRYNIVLEGEFRYRVLDESPPAPYRVGRVEVIPSVPFSDPSREAAAVAETSALFTALSKAMELAPLPEERLSAERLASELALRLRYDAAELQALLKTDSVSDRFDALLSRMREWDGRIRFLAPFRSKDLDAGRN